MLIAQISDCHIVEKGKEWLDEPKTATADRLSKTIDYINSLRPLPDLVFLTGDMTDNGKHLAYMHIKELLEPLKPPLYVLPGNHDHREEVRHTFLDAPYMPKSGYLNYVIDKYPVRLIALDTHLEGVHHGVLTEEHVSWLAEQLQKDSKKPTLIFMHHPPIKVGYVVLDNIICFSPPSFEALIKKSDTILAILSGHYHHLCIGSYAGKLCFLAPSTAPVHYFALPEHDFVTAVELTDPAVTLHSWSPSRGLISHVHSVREKIRLDWKQIQANLKK